MPEGFGAEPEAEDGTVCEGVGGAPESAVREGVALAFVVEGGVGFG